MDESYLTVAEIAELVKVHPQTVRNLIDRGELRAVRIGPRRIRVAQTDLDEFLRAPSPTPDADEQKRENVLLTDVGQQLARPLQEVSDALGRGDVAALANSLSALSEATATLALALEEAQERRVALTSTFP